MSNISELFSGGRGLSWSKVTANTTAKNGNGYLIYASAALTVTLPASPSEGDKVGICDAKSTASQYVLTIARNGNNIEASAQDLIIDTDGSGFELVYVDSTVGWKIVSEITYSLGSSENSVDQLQVWAFE